MKNMKNELNKLNNEIKTMNQNEINENEQIGSVLTKKREHFNDYILYSHGAAFNLKTKTWLCDRSEKTPYLTVKMKDDFGQIHLFLLHRLIYEAFIGEIPEGMQINHINEDKRDNAILFDENGAIVYCNLELVSPKENCNHGTRNEKIANSLRGKLKNR